MEFKEKGVVVEKLGDTMIRVAFDPERYDPSKLLAGKFYKKLSRERGVIIYVGNTQIGLITVEVNPLLIDKNSLGYVVAKIVDELTNSDAP